MPAHHRRRGRPRHPRSQLKTDSSWTDADIEVLTHAALDTLGAHGLTGRARILAFNWRVLHAARARAADVPRVALIEPRTWVPGSPWLAGLDPAAFGADETGMAGMAGSVRAAGSVGAAWLSPWDCQVSAKVIHAAHEAGLRVVPWTVNDPGRLAELISLGADAIVTDRPDVLRAVIAESGGPLPAGCGLPLAGGTPGRAPCVPGT